MSSLLLSWTTRGVKYDSTNYLASFRIGPEKSDVKEEKNRIPLPLIKNGHVHRDMYFTDVLPFLIQMRDSSGPIEYGCFDLNGTLIEDMSLRFMRMNRNILYYTIANLYNISRNLPQFGFGDTIDQDPVPETPKGNWGILLTEECPYEEEILQILKPLVTYRDGKILTMPKLNPPEFLQWLQENYYQNKIPAYLLICDSFENIHLEYQYIFNSFAATGRIWFEKIESFESYTQKILDIEKGVFKVGEKNLIASPVDDTVIRYDYTEIIKPLLVISKKQGIPLENLFENDFNKKTLLSSNENTRFLALYTHGLGLQEKDRENRPELEGAFVLKFDSREEEELLTPNDILYRRFVPGGIIFSPACLAGGTQRDSDFAWWIERKNLLSYLGNETGISLVSQAMLSSYKGPVAGLLHFDVSMGSASPMYNPRTNNYDIQKETHIEFIKNLNRGQTLGKATQPFRWGSGYFYAQAIYLFGQIVGWRPYFGNKSKRKTIGNFIDSMNMYHVTATDMRNYIILGDPAVRLP